MDIKGWNRFNIEEKILQKLKPEINLCLEIGDFLNDWRDNGLEYRFDILGYWDDGLSHATNKIINIYYKNGENIKVNPGRYFSDQNLLAFLTKSGIISRNISDFKFSDEESEEMLSIINAIDERTLNQNPEFYIIEIHFRSKFSEDLFDKMQLRFGKFQIISEYALMHKIYPMS